MPASAHRQFVVSECRGVRWIVRADCADWFLSAIASRYREIEGEPGVEVIKHSLRRIICRINPPLAPDRSLFLKRQAFDSWRYLLKYLVAPSKMAHEWRIAWRLADQGIQSFQPVALGERRRWGTVTESCLVSEEIPGTEMLSRFLETLDERVPPQERRQLIHQLLRSMASLLARLHAAGLYHPDLHGGNFLIRHKGGTDFELFLIDLHAVWRLGLLPPWHERRCLAILARSLPGLMSRGNLARLLAAYVEAAGRRHDWRTLFRPIERQIRKRKFELFEARDRRCLRASSNFAVRREPGRRVTCRRLLEDHPLVTDPAARFDENDSHALTLYDKPSDARAAWSALHGLRIRRVGAPRPHVLVENNGGERKSVVLSEKVAGARPLAEWLRELPPVAQGSAFRRKAALVHAVAERFHAACRAGVKHGACVAENLLAVEGPDGWRVLFAQSPDVRFKRRLTDAEKIEMLAQLAASAGPFSRATAWRFYCICFGGSLAWVRHDAARRIWRKVGERMRRHAAARGPR